MQILIILCLVLMPGWLLAFEPDWSEGTMISREGRKNIFQLSPQDWPAKVKAGRLHAQIYPVEITGSLPPYLPIKNLIEDQVKGFFHRWLSQFIRAVGSLRSFDDVERSLGLHPYPLETDQGVYSVPYPGEARPDHRLGMGLIERKNAIGFTFSCAACHSSQLFGKTVLGMTNRFPRANDFFLQAKGAISAMSPHFFQFWTKSTAAETELFEQTKSNLRYVASKRPQTLGLDTSLAQVALSLNLRAPTAWAEKNPQYLYEPRKDWLDEHSADSKPAVWWNVKYKNRWLSDGSVVSGNPVFTNILWNEIGRGVDLKILQVWLQNNAEVVQEITNAVFASEAPAFTDFFPASMIDIKKAQRGSEVFKKTCARCHGHYQKNWEFLPETAELSERLKTYKVFYHARTPVINVGTDPYRWQGMKSLEKLNKLQISQDHNIVIKAQRGYVPPPLVGIWARWPYFHNNSVPSLCALLMPARQRPKVYWARPAENPADDFDITCNGYPQQLSENKKIKIYKFDSRRQGLSNSGHDEGIFLKDGKEILNTEQKMELIQFLQTL